MPSHCVFLFWNEGYLKAALGTVLKENITVSGLHVGSDKRVQVVMVEFLQLFKNKSKTKHAKHYFILKLHLFILAAYLTENLFKPY